jgi:hypothetical protein
VQELEMGEVLVPGWALEEVLEWEQVLVLVLE